MSYIKFIRIFLLILIVIGIGLLATQKTWVPKVVDVILKTENNQQQISIISDSKIETQDPTKDWKTYTNTKYGYEFKYPDNVGMVSDYDSSFLGPPNNPNEDLLLISDKEESFHFQINKDKISVIKKSGTSDQILSTFKFTK
ncbi:MAG: hypothetical protein A2675_03125 [Candidatus Yonathbacteria bacterium RIFCSPHIGHO2_01_FULL_51_10]|uniref:Uncharacterized protein n=1 Tax=Candidatus Yonathbacteria bacterium RIFCSPHIGHO2_01_FULL_51_10 TaxID=1802723 RepID=A0A1G2S507_9BACT|nr:MAG: hypothetical protein A2675_03125 [Candidatus Yonathbacteria bacterium RIFCSPHIGHO2_01_FULL_51_10]